MSDHNNEDNDKEPIEYKVTFAPGCFDEFDGTQEELDDLVAMIKEMAASGELAERAIPVEDLEDIEDEVLELLPLLNTGNTRH